MANPAHVAFVQQGAAAMTAWREGHPEARLDLEKAALQGLNLRGVTLQGAQLHEADLAGANLERADL